MEKGKEGERVAGQFSAIEMKMGLGRLEICRSGVVVKNAVFDSAIGVLGSGRLA
jgi:hypothetical protein